jgi:hypothetical protein
MHPGGEHSPDIGNARTWNTGDHKRKFMTNAGEYIDGGRRKRGEIVFRGEWEPESEVVTRVEKPVTEGPRYIHRPYWQARKSYRGLQNTDPFVFGDQISYTRCRQYSKRRPTFLRNLDRGSVILFGSHKSGYFVLDTVLVVASWTDHDMRTFRDEVTNTIHPIYRDATFQPIYGNRTSCVPGKAGSAPEGVTFRLYFGATIENSVEGMFSYFPCAKADSKPRGFARPRIHGIPMEAITNGLMMGKRKTEVGSVSEMKIVWDGVRAQVEAQGLALGVATDMPQPMQV